MPAPFLSLLTDDCISTGKDYHNGGARYNTSYIQGVGIGSIADALAAIKTHVYEHQTFSMNELLKMLDANFEGAERSRQLLLNRTPKYGNDDDAVDGLMVRVFESYFNAVDGRRNTKGGEYHINMLPTTCHIYFGSVTGALPDGRFAGRPLSEGVSPVRLLRWTRCEPAVHY
jgi:formate C-acetyltransferase